MKKVIFYVWILTLLTSCSEVLLLGSLGGAVVSQSPAIKAYNGVDAVTIMKTKFLFWFFISFKIDLTIC